MSEKKTFWWCVVGFLLLVAAYSIVAYYNNFIDPLEGELEEKRGRLVSSVWAITKCFGYLTLWKTLQVFFRTLRYSLMAAFFTFFLWMEFSNLIDELTGNNTGKVDPIEYVGFVVAGIIAVGEGFGYTLWAFIAMGLDRIGVGKPLKRWWKKVGEVYYKKTNKWKSVR